jgi:hypothetical protein
MGHGIEVGSSLKERYLQNVPNAIARLDETRGLPILSMSPLLI